MKDIATRLKQARISAGYITAISFAKKLNISQATYAAHESGRNGLKVEVAKKYAELLGIDYIWLLTGETNQEKRLQIKNKIYYGKDRFVPLSENRLDFLHSIHGQDSNFFVANTNLKSSMKVVDVSCYNGAMSCDLAQFIGESGHIHAFHNNEEHIYEAMQKARSQQLKNITFYPLSIDKIPNIIQDADYVYCRFFLHNCEDPISSIKSMLSILKHGGTLAIEEATHKEFFHYPENPIFSKAVELLLQQGKIKNVDFNFGEKLYTTLKRFQVTDLKVSSSQPIGITKQDKMMMEYITRDCKDFYIKENLCSTNEINEIIHQLELLAEQDDSIMGYTKVFQVSCKKA